MGILKKKVSEMPQVGDILKFIVYGYDASTGKSAKANMEQLRGNVGKTPVITMTVKSIDYGQPPTVTKSGTDENVGFDIGIPKGKDGERPELRKSVLGIEWKFESEAADAWKLLIPLSDLKMRLSDLTEAEIEELQQPALEASQRMDDYLYKQKQEVDELKSDLTDAIDSANDTADHPAIIGDDGYWYKWNKQAQTYDKTTHFSKGDPFTIAKNYGSIAEMEADHDNPDVPVGSFVAIVSNIEDDDNAKIYIKTEVGFDFWIDMSGARGFTGKTPQFFVGTVNTGAAGTTVSVSITEDGVDPQGNPRYRINMTIPRGDNGKGPIVMPNGNYGNWDETAGQYVDSGVNAAATVNLEDVPVTFTEAAERATISSGDTVPVLFGKIKKWFSDFGSLAWKNKVDYTADIDNLPTLQEVFTIGGGLAMSAAKVLSATGNMPVVTANANTSAVRNTIYNVTTQYTSGRTFTITAENLSSGDGFIVMAYGNTPITFTASGSTIVKCDGYDDVTPEASKYIVYTVQKIANVIVVNRAKYAA